ncbi:MAG: GIY-YIG nuclease family protein [Cyclobacteriaceae bacterium]|nr:GIY-YIG nuclease family protein [Cyclobacteriaceae bacterium]
MYAIVDIETTGNYTLRSRITEIAIYIYDGEKVTDTFHTLINPESSIPPYISSLTGITNQMVEKAPKFYEVAKTVYQLLDKRIFVAHNVNFDYNFIRQEFKSLGGDFQARKLCTVRLARKIMPGLPSYGLGNLAKHLNIEINSRHRAFGDAEATVKIFEVLKDSDKEGCIQQSLKKGSHEAALPPNLPREQFEQLPEEPGVYYFFDARGKVIYVGKAINIKNRIRGHFTPGSETTRKQHMFRDIHGVSYEVCGNELVSLLFENHEIHRLWPLYNQAQKRISWNYGIYLYEDQRGYQRFSISRTHKTGNPVCLFKSLTDARNFIRNKTEEFELCPKLTGLQKSPGSCFDYQIKKCPGACVGEEKASIYNKRVNKALQSLSQDNLTAAIIGKGRCPEESSVVWIEHGKYTGFGFFNSQTEILHSSQLKEFIRHFPDNQDIQRILQSFLRNGKDYRILTI